jgi:hypothetical protein
MIRFRLLIYGLFLIFLGILSCTTNKVKQHKSIELSYDSTSLIRNPAMGWGLYDDASGEVQNAEEYWKVQDEVARKYASFFMFDGVGAIWNPKKESTLGYITKTTKN